MKNVSPILIKNSTIHTENGIVKNSDLFIENGKITGVFSEPPTDLPANMDVIYGENLHTLPGFIDGHIHGGYDVDVMDATEESLDTLVRNLPQEGTTSFLATTITQSHENIEKALRNVANYKNKAGQSEVIGVHLEGPFVEKSKAGAQPVEFIMNPDYGLFQKWQKASSGLIKMVTMAPEHAVDGTFIQKLVEDGVTVSAGHTAANFKEMKDAVAYGVSQVTHLCNAMSGLHHRDIGVVGAAFMIKDLRGELIADGIHVSDEMLALIYQNIGSERINLITDSMRAKGLPDGDYELGGQVVSVSNGRAELKDGTLAGSILKMNEAAQRMLTLTGVSIEDIINMASVNPAKQIDIFDRKGSIAIGKDADIILVDDDMNVFYTICQGVTAFRRG